MPVMHEIRRPQFEQSLDKVVIIPVGSTEQHGPHLPLGVDTYIAEGISEILAEKTGAIVAPAFSYGCKSKPLSGGGPLFKGTIDLNGTTMISLMYDVLCEFARDGIKKVFVNNAHFENQAFLDEAMDLATREFPELKCVQSNWWDVLDQKTTDEIFSDVPFPGWAHRDLSHDVPEARAREERSHPGGCHREGPPLLGVPAAPRHGSGVRGARVPEGFDPGEGEADCRQGNRGLP